MENSVQCSNAVQFTVFHTEKTRTASPPPLLSLRSAGWWSPLGVGEMERCWALKVNSGCTSLFGLKAVWKAVWNNIKCYQKLQKNMPVWGAPGRCNYVRRRHGNPKLLHNCLLCFFLAEQCHMANSEWAKHLYPLMKWNCWLWNIHCHQNINCHLHNTWLDAFVIQKNFDKRENNLYEHILTWDPFLI